MKLSIVKLHCTLVAVAVSLVAISLPGCKKSSGGVAVYGKVSYHGSPIEKGSLTYFPTSGRPISTPVIDGKYELEVKPGEYVAVVDLAAELPPGFKEGDPVPPPKLVLPAQYTTRAKSPLKAIVAANQDKPIDFDLK